MFSKHEKSAVDKSNRINTPDTDKTLNSKSKVDKLLDKADENIDSFDYEIAKKFCQRALELEPENVRAIETTAGLCVEMGDTEEATNLYQRAIQLCPDSGHSKYLSMGQFSEGTTSLDYYRKGTEILEKAIKEKQPEDSATNCESEENLSRVLSNVYCAVAELYMTDLCDEENADEMCSSFAQRAITSDETNPEAYQMMASYLLTKNEETLTSKAREMMEKSLSFWFSHYQAVKDGEEEGGDTEICPLSFSSRISAVKILLELEKYAESETILNGLVEEDDEDVEVWYLLGWLNHIRGEMYSGNAKYYFHKCKKVSDKVNYTDTALINHIDELLKQYGPEEDDDDEDDNDKECEIESSEEEMEES